ncbi:formamidopyrimidine-DNA glycosylase [Mycobacteroides chelonae]|nr:formamidopyrimidine-DNA glycosylase [Mycobacteroides chelonae]
MSPVSIVLPAVVLGVTAGVARLLQFDRADRIIVIFCGSKKSLAPGLPMATVLSVALGISLGVLDVVERAREGDVVGYLGPDLLGPDWDPAVAVQRLIVRSEDPLSAVLLDQRVMAGIGNVYCNELCFLVGVLPSTPVKDVADPERLVVRAHTLLQANKNDHRRTTTGDRRPGRELWVYGRHGKACRRCGTPIAREQSSPRVTYWCPSCQR